MKLLIVVGAVLLFSLTTFAQNQVAIFAGPQATTSKYRVNGRLQENEFKYGFQAGALMKVPFESNLYFTPAAFYSMKGYKVKFTDFTVPPDINAIDNNTNIHCFELAALLQWDLGNKPSHFFIKLGPSLDFQLSGKEKLTLVNGNKVTQKMTWGPNSYGRFSANYHGQFGYETNSGFIFLAQYTYGATSINNADFGPRIRHRAVGISIGKYLKKNKIVIDTRNKE